MAGITVDPAGLNGYANTVDRAAEDLSRAGSDLTGLSAASFGQLGSDLGAPQAYARVRALLLAQLTSAGAGLHSAAAGLRSVAAAHTETDTEHAGRLGRVRQG